MNMEDNELDIETQVEVVPVFRLRSHRDSSSEGLERLSGARPGPMVAVPPSDEGSSCLSRDGEPSHCLMWKCHEAKACAKSAAMPPADNQCPRCNGTGANPDFPLANCSCWLAAMPPTDGEIDLALIRPWPDGMQARLEHVWRDLVGFIPSYKLYDLQHVLAEFGFTMKVFGSAPQCRGFNELVERPQFEEAAWSHYLRTREARAAKGQGVALDDPQSPHDRASLFARHPNGDYVVWVYQASWGGWKMARGGL